MAESCRNCGSTEIYTNPVQVGNMARTNGMAVTPWNFNLRVCVSCGLTDWFFAKQDLDWVKRKFFPLVTSVPEDVAAALKDGNKIEAIRLYCRATGVGVAEAKEFVEEIQRRSAEG